MKTLRRISIGLVVIVVVGFVVVGVFAPSLCRSRETANRVKCASNLRQIGIAILQYARQNGGEFPRTVASFTTVQHAESDDCCPLHHHNDLDRVGQEILFGDGHMATRNGRYIEELILTASQPAR